MRVFKASSYDHKVLAALFAQKESPLCEDYASSLAGLMSSVFVGTDFWSRAVSNGFGLELMEVVLNCKPLQDQWAAENGLVVEGADWMLRILCEQVRRFDPEVLIFHDQEYLDVEFQAEVLRHCRPRLVVAWDGIARCDAARFANCHLVLTNFPFVRDFYRSAGLRAEVLPYSFHADIAEQLGTLERIYPLTFAGSLVVRSDLHVRRLRLVGELAKRFPLTVRATGSILQWKGTERTHRRRLRQLQRDVRAVAGHVLLALLQQPAGHWPQRSFAVTLSLTRELISGVYEYMSEDGTVRYLRTKWACKSVVQSASLARRIDKIA
jgi:hypothetical protein